MCLVFTNLFSFFCHLIWIKLPNYRYLILCVIFDSFDFVYFICYSLFEALVFIRIKFLWVFGGDVFGSHNITKFILSFLVEWMKESFCVFRIYDNWTGNKNCKYIYWIIVLEGTQITLHLLILFFFFNNQIICCLLFSFLASINSIVLL
jgi:hypothetical protein